jgi:hypothetical protein
VAGRVVGAAVAEAVARVRKVCVDAVDPVALGRWWADVLELEWRPWPNGEGGLYAPGEGDQPRIWFNGVPEPKTVKHRWHLDIYTASLDDLTAKGATVVVPEGDDRRWTVMADPEGGEFCAFVRDPVPAPRMHGLNVDCANPAALARWWVGLLGGTIKDYSGDHTEVSGTPGMTYTFDFGKVPEPKVIKNRVHLDLAVADPALLRDAGATPLGGDVYADPEGNEFCAITRP